MTTFKTTPKNHVAHNNHKTLSALRKLDKRTFPTHPILPVDTLSNVDTFVINGKPYLVISNSYGYRYRNDYADVFESIPVIDSKEVYPVKECEHGHTFSLYHDTVKGKAELENRTPLEDLEKHESLGTCDPNKTFYHSPWIPPYFEGLPDIPDNIDDWNLCIFLLVNGHITAFTKRVVKSLARTGKNPITRDVCMDIITKGFVNLGRFELCDLESAIKEYIMFWCHDASESLEIENGKVLFTRDQWHKLMSAIESVLTESMGVQRRTTRVNKCVISDIDKKRAREYIGAVSLTDLCPEDMTHDEYLDMVNVDHDVPCGFMDMGTIAEKLQPVFECLKVDYTYKDKNGEKVTVNGLSGKQYTKACSILILKTKDYTDREIADMLSIGKGTVNRIYNKCFELLRYRGYKAIARILKNGK